MQPASSRAELEDAFTHSQLDGVCRDLMFVFAYLADPRTAVIAPQHQPSLTALAELSGWDRSTVVRHRQHLRAEGWIRWKAPSKSAQRRLHQHSLYALLLPPGAASTGLGAERSGLGAASTGLGADDTGARCTEPPELGAASTGLGAERTAVVDGLKSSTSRSAPWDTPALLEVAEVALAGIGHPAVTRELCVAVVREVLDGADDVRRPARYIRAAIRKEPRKWLPVPAQPAPPAANGHRAYAEDSPDWAAARDKLRKGAR